MNSPSNLPALAAALFVAYTVGTVVYNLFLHPLAKYPGPLLAKITGWYEFMGVKDGYHHLWLYDLHQQYGPVVRVAPNRLSYNTVEALHSIYVDRKSNIQKAGFTEVLAHLKGDFRNLQTLNDRHTYNIRRRLIAHAFSEEALRSSEEFILSSVRDWCEIIRSKADVSSSWTVPLDMRMWSNLLTQDVLGELCFGESFGACRKGDSDFDQITEAGCIQAQTISWMPVGNWFYRCLKVVAEYGIRHNWEALKPQIDYDKTMDAMIQRRWALPENSRKDFFGYIIKAKDPETGTMINAGTINVEAGVLFGAGVDTSSTCIAALLFYLTKYPDVLAKLTSELRTTFTNVEQIVQGPELKSLVYLRACIDETLRISPPAPGPMLREVMAGGIQIMGDFIPAGTQVSVPAYVIHHNEEYFPESFTFKPERWLDGSKEAHKEAFHAFSNGLRVCVGRSLAYLEMQLALARLLFLFDIRPAPERELKDDKLLKEISKSALMDSRGKIEYKFKDWFITGRHGPVIQFKART